MHKIIQITNSDSKLYCLTSDGKVYKWDVVFKPIKIINSTNGGGAILGDTVSELGWVEMKWVEMKDGLNRN